MAGLPSSVIYKPSQAGWVQKWRSEQPRNTDLPKETDTSWCVVDGQSPQRQGKPREPLVPRPETWVNEVPPSLPPGHQPPAPWGFVPVSPRGRTATGTSRPCATAAARRRRPRPSSLPANGGHPSSSHARAGSARSLFIQGPSLTRPLLLPLHNVTFLITSIQVSFLILANTWLKHKQS